MIHAVEIKDVTKMFGATTAVKNVTLSIGKGEFFSFLGPSGCGKTTVLRMIAGFEKPTSGQILIDGKDIVGMPPHKRPVNMVFQSYALFPHLTILDNVCFGLKFENLAKSVILEKAKQALSLVRLEHLKDRVPFQLSGGQQQRIALARAIVKEPSVLLLDEPLSALDPQIREEMQSELSRLQRTLNMTFVMVTHDQDEALALSHRIAVFCQGNLDQVGSPQEIYEQPGTEFVARFIGQTNIFNCIVDETANNAVSVKTSDGTAFGASGAMDYKVGDSLLGCIKPEEIILSPESASNRSGGLTSFTNGTNGTLGLSGEIKNISYKGDTTDCLVDTSFGVMRVEVPRTSESLSPGMKVSLQMRTDAIKFVKAAKSEI